MLLSSLATDKPKLLCQKGAGKGKSRVAAALAFHFLSVSKKQVYIVFADEGFKNRDEKQCKNLWTFATADNPKAGKRLHHVIGLDQVPKNKGSIVIVDESDAIMLTDPINCYKQTNHKDTKGDLPYSHS